MRQAYKEAKAILTTLRGEAYAPSGITGDDYHDELDELESTVEELHEIIHDLEEERRWIALQGIRRGR